MIMGKYSVIVVFKHGRTVEKNVDNIDSARAIMEVLQGLNESDKERVTGARVRKI